MSGDCGEGGRRSIVVSSATKHKSAAHLCLRSVSGEGSRCRPLSLDHHDDDKIHDAHNSNFGQSKSWVATESCCERDFDYLIVTFYSVEPYSEILMVLRHVQTAF